MLNENALYYLKILSEINILYIPIFRHILFQSLVSCGIGLQSLSMASEMNLLAMII